MGFQAADNADKAIMLWKAEIANLEDDLKSKEQIEARIFDLYRNNDLMRGLVEKMVDTVVGSKVLLQSMPDYEALGVGRDEALRWQKIVEREFHHYVDSPDNWISADRSMDFTQLCRQAYRSKIFTGEITASLEWRYSQPEGYKTCINLFSPNRIKTPPQTTDAFFGIELDNYGGAIAYHIEKTNLDTKDSLYRQKEFKRVLKRNKYGYLQLIHIFEPLLPEYPRGISRLACVLKKMKQLDRYHEADLDKAIITTAYVFAITSDEDPETVAEILSGVSQAKEKYESLALGGGDSNIPADLLAKRDSIRNRILEERWVEVTGGNIMHLFSGEDIKTVAPPNTITSSAEFAKGHTRNIANGIGISYELGSGDFEGVNYSGGQLSLGIYEHSANIERKLYAHKFATLVFRAWLDEAIDKGKVPLLGGVDYWSNRDKYSKCTFTGVKRVHVDPLKAANAHAKSLASGTTTRTDIVQENGGDMDSIAINRSYEASLMLKTIESVAAEQGIKLTDEFKLNILADYITGRMVDLSGTSLRTDEDVEKEE